AAKRTAVNPIEVEDCSAAVLEFANGSLATLSATLGAATQTSRLRFVFEHLTVESNSTAYEFTGDPWTFTAPDAERQRAVDGALADLPETYPAGESFAGQFAAFHRALVTGTTPPVTLADSRQSLELVTAIYHSARCGDPVSLPLAADHPGYRSWLPPDRAPPLTA
ncbi:MAG: Gfo/Idh/MocA family oxidoreductase, partial [Azospirillaceae bacterium]